MLGPVEGMGVLSQDRELLARWRAGEEDALRAVFRHYAPVVARSIRRGVKIMREGQTFVFAGPSQELEVERLVHETFSRAFAHRARMAYDGITPYAGYLCRVARNFMITEARAAKHAPMLTHSGELPDLESLQPSPEETAQTEQLVTLAREFLTTRPEDERQVFDARFRHSESQEMAARRLGVSRMVVRRAEARLKAAFVAFLGERNALEQTGGGAGVSHEA